AAAVDPRLRGVLRLEVGVGRRPAAGPAGMGVAGDDRLGRHLGVARRAAAEAAAGTRHPAPGDRAGLPRRAAVAGHRAAAAAGLRPARCPQPCGTLSPARRRSITTSPAPPAAGYWRVMSRTEPQLAPTSS